MRRCRPPAAARAVPASAVMGARSACSACTASSSQCRCTASPGSGQRVPGASGKSACSTLPAASTFTRVKAPKYCTSRTVPLAPRAFGRAQADALGPQHRAGAAGEAPRRVAVQHVGRADELATKRVAGASYTCCGVPTCSSRPWLNTPMRSLIDSASCWSWVMNRKVMPRRRCSAFSSLCICSRSFRSSAPSGSSSSSTCGWLISARASATRWRWPPDSCAGRRSPTPGSSTSASNSSARRVRSALSTLRTISA